MVSELLSGGAYDFRENINHLDQPILIATHRI